MSRQPFLTTTRELDRPNPPQQKKLTVTHTTMLAREAADFKILRRKSTEQKIGNLLEVGAPETIFSGKCGLRA